VIVPCRPWRTLVRTIGPRKIRKPIHRGRACRGIFAGVDRELILGKGNEEKISRRRRRFVR
jgi:hypothetical protein